MRRLAGYLRRYRARYAAGGACLLLTATLAMAVPYLLKRAVDAIERGAPFATVAQFALAIVAIAVVQSVVRTLSRALIFNVGRDVEHDLRGDLFAHLERLPVAYYQQQQTGDLMSRLINDVTAIRMLLGVGVLNLVNTPIYYVYGVGIMLTIDPVLTLMALLPFPILLWVVKRVSRTLMEQTLRVQEGLAALSSAVQENISGIHVVKAYDAETVAVQRFAQLNDEFSRQNVALAKVRGRLMPLMRLAAGFGTLMVLWVGGWQVIAGRIGLGDLVAFMGYLNLLAWPTMALGWMLSILQRGRAALLRLEHIFATEPAIADPPDAMPLPAVAGRVEFRNVSFAYPGRGNGHPVVSNVSFTLEPGEKLAIVGRTGAGKSSLVQLLPRLFDVSEGAVLLDGRDVRTLPLAQLRGAIGFVPQDPFLFSTRIRDNVAFALDAPDEAAVRRAAAVAGVADDIEAFPRGYDTVVGERGITLSGGQKQRLTLARAVAPAPRVLVLDDALSSVDTRTEHAILQGLREVMAGKTSIVIAHRVSTIMDADHIAVLDGGRIVELGDHAALLARDGLYADLYRQQQLEDEIETL
ncbi:MAG: ABC transporter ATP-binding protein [Deltaproteobacteria bacterium]|nr:ABC transporter ATP-binding protein [Deltaproteobacteria bacterium]